MVCVKEKKPPGPSCSQQTATNQIPHSTVYRLQAHATNSSNSSKFHQKLRQIGQHRASPLTIIFIIQPLTELLLGNSSGSGQNLVLSSSRSLGPASSALLQSPPGSQPLGPPYTTHCKAPPRARLSLKFVQIRFASKNYLIFCVNTRELFSADIINGEI